MEKGVFFYPRPYAAYLPDLPLTKKAVAIPPNIAPAIIDAPNTPSALRYGVPEPVAGLSAAF